MSRLLNMVTRGVLRSSRATTGFFRQITTSLAADTPDDVDHFQVHGLSSRPAADAPVLALACSGNPEHLVGLVAGKGPDVDGTVLYDDRGWSVQALESEFNVTKDGTKHLKVTSTEVVLGTNPAAAFVARVGDAVQIVIPSGPAAGTYVGVITGGSSVVRAG